MERRTVPPILTSRCGPWSVLVVVVLFLSGCSQPVPQPLGPGVPVAPGVQLLTTTDSSLVGGDGPIAAYLLRIDPSKVRISSALSNDEVVDAEPVDAIARRRDAIAGVNGGFFNRTNGEPIGVLKVDGELVSDAGITRGVVAITNTPDGSVSLAFDRVSAKLVLRFTSGGADWSTPIDGVDTTRERGRLMLYTPSYHADTDTAPTGTEFVLDGRPLAVTEIRAKAGHTRIPRRGAVLSFGGTTLPPALDALHVGTAVSLETIWRSALGVPGQLLERADQIVNGAGLLRRRGLVLSDWRPEALSADVFVDARHPRTWIGADMHGFIWLGVVDGRQPDHSIGMTFADLQRLADRLDLVDLLNLDGGGSTTMVVGGRIVNQPSDPGGPRPVSDAVLVLRPDTQSSLQ